MIIVTDLLIIDHLISVSVTLPRTAVYVTSVRKDTSLHKGIFVMLQLVKCISIIKCMCHWELLNLNRAGAQQFIQVYICAQLRLRLAYASSQSGQRLRCMIMVSVLN